tara:strand:- start:3186 stop:4160 length:975 start_codon:yes stop_codon:yes gene_type:complete
MIKKLNNKSLSLTISGDPYGYGHFKRMIILKLKLKKSKIDNTIINVSKLNLNSLKKIDLNIYRVIFIDFSNDLFFKKKKLNTLINHLDSYKGKIFIFDSVEKKIIRFVLKNKKRRYLICPYFLTKKKEKVTKKFNCYYGPNYFLFDKIYLNNRKSQKLNKIFLSCGGLDHYNYTYKIAKEIFLINPQIEIHACIGPIFKKENIKLIKLLKKNNKFYLYNSIKNLSQVSQKCDLAIVSSGLTKYEMAASKINLAVFSENSMHARYNSSFVNSRLAYNLSNFDNVNSMKYKLTYLLNNYYKIYYNDNKYNKNLLKNNKFNMILQNV